MFSPEFPSDPSQFIDFAQLSETEDISSEESKSGPQQSAVPTHFHQLTPPAGDTSGQHGNAEQCNIDNKHFSDNLNILNYRENAYKGLETDKNDYTCHYLGCTVITKARKEYLTHRKTHGQPFIYECKVPDCGRTFDHRSSFYTHIETHEPRPQCEDCGKFLVNRNALRKHKRLCQKKSHERCYECLYPGCATVTKIRKEYLTHRKTHGQPFIYECRVAGCGRTFNHDSTLYYHKQTHEFHPQCERCGKLFVSRNGLNYHKKRCPTKSQNETQFGHPSQTLRKGA